jgi:hypothetical protein
LQQICSLVKKLFFFFCFFYAAPILLCAQTISADSVKVDSVKVVPQPVAVNKYQAALDTLLKQNSLLNSSGTPVSLAVKLKKDKTESAVFYLLAGLVFLLAVIKFFFAKYFTNLFRVFFNSSLRQNQFTDQLLQAKLPSLFFNIFFIISGGIYIYFLLLQYGLVTGEKKWMIISSCIVLLAIIYFVKLATLKLTGWATGFTETTDTYIFVIFLIAKIIGIILIPFTILMAFAALPLPALSALISLLIIAVLLLLRFFRSYGLLQNQLKVSKFHFFLYIAGLEIIPLLLIYKGLLFLLTKNL